MAKIFTETDPPTLDYARAAEALKGGREVATIHAAALLDIAVSLSTLVQLAQQAEGGFELDDDDTRDGDLDDDRPGDGFDTFDIDDRVTATVDEVTSAGVIVAVGQSEGEDWAEVSWDVDEGEDAFVTRVWVDALTRERPAEDVDADFEKPAKVKKSKKGKGDDA